MGLVAFKFVIGDAVPKVSYMTVLDKYALVCSSMVFLVAVLVAVLPLLNGAEEVRTLEATYIVPGLAVLWIGFQLIIFCRVVRWNMLLRREMGRALQSPPE